ncbi:MAG: ferritin family protein [Candidatus Abyssubacteria bacterium]
MAQILDIAGLVKKLVLIEAEGVAFYEALVEHTDNAKVKELARMMARAERGHKEGFEKLAKKLEGRRKTKTPEGLEESIQRYILALIDHRIFLSPEQAATAAKNYPDLKSAVDMAIRFEKENILLLRECLDIVNRQEKKIIQMIIEEERAHILGLQRAAKELSTSG